MSTGVDESAYLGSAVSTTPVVKKSEENKAKVDQIQDSRKTVQAQLAPAADLLLEIIERQILKEKDLEHIRSKASLRVKQGQLPREALADELLYCTGRLDSLVEVRTLLQQAKRAKNGAPNE